MIIVNTMGRFQVLLKNNILNEESMRSSMLTKLMTYMLLHREQTISAEDLSEALWQEGEVDNPVGALKNLMYRLRRILKQYLGDEEFIITNVGSYQWNPNIRVSMDIEEFEALCKRGKNAAGTEEEIVCFENAVHLYQGNFMSKIADLHWVMSLNAYYHSLFLTAIKGLAEAYLKIGYFDKMEIVCKNALQYEDADEQLYYYLILARVYMNKIKLAQETYEKAQEILYREVGIRDSKILQKAFRILLKEKKGKEAENIKAICNAISEENPEGAYVCGYQVFKEIYRVEARRMQRMPGQEHMLLFTVLPLGKVQEKVGQIEQFFVTKIMDKFQKILVSSLRKCDVVARYSDMQYILLLTECSYECSLIVANRIISNFYGENNEYRNVKIEVSFKNVFEGEALEEKTVRRNVM